MNMKLPNIYFSPEEIGDPEVIDYLAANTTVISCYIFTPLERYDFLASFPKIVDLQIRYGIHLTSLSFMRTMKSWRMLYLEDAHLDNLSDAFPPDKKQDFGICLSLLACEIKDISALTQSNLRLSELIISRQKAQSDEKERWKTIQANTYKYYQLTNE
jgi:hypothetical protein